MALSLSMEPLRKVASGPQHCGYRSLLINFAYTPELTFPKIFGSGHHDYARQVSVAEDILAEMWLKYAQSVSSKCEWGLQALLKNRCIDVCWLY